MLMYRQDWEPLVRWLKWVLALACWFHGYSIGPWTEELRVQFLIKGMYLSCRFPGPGGDSRRRRPVDDVSLSCLGLFVPLSLSSRSKLSFVVGRNLRGYQKSPPAQRCRPFGKVPNGLLASAWTFPSDGRRTVYEAVNFWIHVNTCSSCWTEIAFW